MAISSVIPSSAATPAGQGKPVVGFFQDDGSCRDFRPRVLLSTRPNLCLYFENWAGAKTFPLDLAKELRSQGVTLMISWQPWDSDLGYGRQSRYSLGAIAQGRFDKYVRNWARQAAAFKGKLLLRFAHEMNGPWYPWGVNHAGNSAKKYVTAWRHIHGIFLRAGATNVRWVWAPYAVHGKANKVLRGVYPGDKYVDVLGPAGYARRQSGTYKSVFAETIAAIEKISTKPIVISETAVTNKVSKKLPFIQSFFTGINADKRIRGFVWFDSQRSDSPWKLANPNLVRAFKAGLARFQKVKG